MRLVGYVRVSRVSGRGGDTFISPAVQRERIAQLAAAHGHSVTSWVEDLDQPGSRLERPGFQQALAAVEDGDADGIAVAKLDRFARSVAGAAQALARLEAAGGVLVAVDLGMDTSTPAGKLMRNVLMALAEFELDRIRESWRDARGRAVSRGVHISRVPPVGYLRARDGRLTPDPDAAAAVGELFARRAQGEAWSELCKFLDERAPRDGAWPVQTVTGVIRNRVYLGEARQGEFVNEHAHEPLVTREVWEAAQATSRRRASRGGGALLAGLLRCAGCGYPMTRQGDGARGYVNYRCRARHAAGVCPEPARISERRADEHVTERFLAFAAEAAVRDAPLTVEVERAVSAVEEAEHELAAYRDAAVVSVIGADHYRAGLDQRSLRVEAAANRLAQLRRVSVPLAGRVRLADEWPTLAVAERQRLLAAAVDAVFVRRAHLAGRAPFEDRVWICWAGEAPTDLPGRRVGGLRAFSFPVD